MEPLFRGPRVFGPGERLEVAAWEEPALRDQIGHTDLIINCTSVTAYRGSKHLVDYSATKGALVSFTRSLAGQLAEKGIRVNGVAPGRVETESPGRTGPSTDPAFLELAKKRIPLGRFCPVEDVAEAVRYLASPAAAYITGHTLVLDGGVTVA